MTISWTMVIDFVPRFAITTGAWNHSYAALERTKECVIAIPTVDLLDRVVGIGTCSGADTDKFADKVGTQFVSTVYHGRATYEAGQGEKKVRFICLHAGYRRGPVFVYTLPE